MKHAIALVVGLVLLTAVPPRGSRRRRAQRFVACSARPTSSAILFFLSAFAGDGRIDCSLNEGWPRASQTFTAGWLGPVLRGLAR